MALFVAEMLARLNKKEKKKIVFGFFSKVVKRSSPRPFFNVTKFNEKIGVFKKKCYINPLISMFGVVKILVEFLFFSYN